MSGAPALPADFSLLAVPSRKLLELSFSIFLNLILLFFFFPGYFPVCPTECRIPEDFSSPGSFPAAGQGSQLVEGADAVLGKQQQPPADGNLGQNDASRSVSMLSAPQASGAGFLYTPPRAAVGSPPPSCPLAASIGVQRAFPAWPGLLYSVRSPNLAGEGGRWQCETAGGAACSWAAGARGAPGLGAAQGGAPKPLSFIRVRAGPCPQLGSGGCSTEPHLLPPRTILLCSAPTSGQHHGCWRHPRVSAGTPRFPAPFSLVFNW